MLDDQIPFLMHFENGAIGVIEGGTPRPTGMMGRRFEVVNTEGGIGVERNALLVGRGEEASDGYARRFEFRHPGGMVAMLRAFLEAIRDNRYVPMPAEAGRYAFVARALHARAGVGPPVDHGYRISLQPSR